MRKVKKPREARGRLRFLDDGERVKLLDACKESSSPLLYPCVVLALSTRMRYSELMGLRWPDVNLKDRLCDLAKDQERRPAASPVCWPWFGFVT